MEILATPAATIPRYMTVHQVAEYLQLNEKKVYALVNEQRLPATKVTGKWMFPRELVDQWLLESSHKGLLMDRLTVAGPDDFLLLKCMGQLQQRNANHALIAFVHMGTRTALELLAAGRVDVAMVNWGPSDQSQVRHPALLDMHKGKDHWILVRGLRRELGVIFRTQGNRQSPRDWQSLAQGRWCQHSSEDGTWRFLQESAAANGIDLAQLEFSCRVENERESAARITSYQADFCCGPRSLASQFGLGFLSLGYENLDFAMARGIWFRRMFQMVLETLRQKTCRELSDQLGGYEYDELGELVWGDY